MVWAPKLADLLNSMMVQIIRLKRIALLGCGAIGTEIAMAIDSGKVDARLTHVYDKMHGRAQMMVARLDSKPEIVGNSHLLSSNNADLIVEAASQDAVRDVALGVLQNRKDIMILSAGALLDKTIFEVLSDACREFNRRIHLPSGAIAGLDGLNAVRNELSSVMLTTTKHPRSLAGARFFKESKINPLGITTPTTIFDGTAVKAVELFPANINVAALVSLAGVGGSSTRVRIVADPNTTMNMHRIDARGEFGEMSFVIRNTPDRNNPRTSRLAILSAIEKLRVICSDEIHAGT